MDTSMTLDALKNMIESGAYSPGGYPSNDAFPDKEQRTAARRAWQKSRRERTVAFREDLELACGVHEGVAQSKLDLLYSHCWEDSHADGLQAVADSYVDLVPLIRP